jgi:hypothetical protein
MVFEVIEIGPPTKKRLFRKAVWLPVKMRATTPMTCEVLRRTFEGHGNYSTQTYRANFGEGEVVTVHLHASDIVAVGDMRSIESLTAQGYLRNYMRLVGTAG